MDQYKLQIRHKRLQGMRSLAKKIWSCTWTFIRKNLKFYAENYGILFAVKHLLLLKVQAIFQQLSNKPISFKVSALENPI